MVEMSENWIKTTLKLMGLPNIQFLIKVVGNNLRVQFKNPVLDNRIKEKILFRSFAYLIMSTMRNTFRQGFRNLKVVLTIKE